jgi:hypothetical protein
MIARRLDVGSFKQNRNGTMVSRRPFHFHRFAKGTRLPARLSNRLQDVQRALRNGLRDLPFAGRGIRLIQPFRAMRLVQKNLTAHRRSNLLSRSRGSTKRRLSRISLAIISLRCFRSAVARSSVGPSRKASAVSFSSTVYRCFR